jgi:hypothetical protein
LGNAFRGRASGRGHRCHSIVDYLATQIREQNKERRRAGINILTAQWSELVKTAQENREFAALFLRGSTPSKVLAHPTN